MTVKRAVASMAIATVVSRIFGFLRIIVVAAVLGTTALGNTFQSTNAMSNVLFDLLAAGALSAAIVPQLVHALEKSEKDIRQLFSSLVSLVLIGLGAVSLLGVIFASQISELLFSRAPIETRADQIEAGALLLRFFMPQIVLYGLGAIAVAALIAKKRFIAQVVAPIGGSIFIMIAVTAFYFVHDSTDVSLQTKDIVILGIAGTGACLAFVSIPIVVAMRNGLSFLPSGDVKRGLGALANSTWAVAIQASAAILLAMSIFVGNKLAGAVVAYQLAFMLFLAPYAIISQSFSTVLLPDLSKTALKEKENEDFGLIVNNMMTWTYRPMVAITGLCFALSVPITHLVSQGRASGGQEMVEIAFISLILGLVPYSIYQAASRVYFAKTNIRLPAVTIVISSTVVAFVGLIGSSHLCGNKLLLLMGIAHTLAYTFAAGVLLFLLRKDKYDVFPNLTTWLIALAAAFYGLIGYLISQSINFEGKFVPVLYIALFTVANLALVLIVLPQDKKDWITSRTRTMLKKEKI